STIPRVLKYVFVYRTQRGPYSQAIVLLETNSLIRKVFHFFLRAVLCIPFVSSALVHVVACAEDTKSIRPSGYVTDLAGVIDSSTKTRLEALCTEVEKKTGAQMAIVTVHSLEGETAAQYANELFKQLGVGGKKDDRGVLILVAPTERKYWT